MPAVARRRSRASNSSDSCPVTVASGSRPAADSHLSIWQRTAPSDVGDATATAAGVRPHFAIAALLSVLFLTFLDNTVISAALSDVQSQLHSGVTDLQWVVGAYALVFASFMLICGSLGDNFGRKRIMLVGVGVCCVGSIICAIATSSDVLVAGRAVMGLGAAGSEPATLSMIRHIYPTPRRRA